MEAIPHTFHLLLRTSSTFRQVFGRSVRIQRDLHHVLTNARKLPHAISHGQPYASYIAGEVQFTSGLPSSALFSCAWESIMCEFLDAGRVKTANWMQETLLTYSSEQQNWSAKWQSGLTVSFPPPGNGTATCHQSLERYNGVLKCALPCKYHTWSLSVVTPLVEETARGIMRADPSVTAFSLLMRPPVT